MAKIIGRTQTGVLVEMAPADIKKISGENNLGIGSEFNIAPIYNKLNWIINKKTELESLANQLKDSGDNLNAALNAVT